eukprot:gene13506-13625_t
MTVASWLFLPQVLAEEPAAPKDESVAIDTETNEKIQEPSKILTIETTQNHVAVSNESHTLIAAMIGAYKNNPDLQQKRHVVLATHEQYVQATAGWRPNITLGGSITGNARSVSGNSKDADGPSVGTSGSSANTREGNLQLTQNLYNGGATTADISKADQIKAFLDLLSQYSQVELYKANKIALQKNYESAVEKRNIGEETQTQVANAEAKLAEAEAQLLTAEAQLEGLKAAYTQITGLQPAAQMKKPEPFLNLLPADLKSAVQLAKDQHPDVIAAQFDHLVAQSETQRIGGGLLPTVNVSATSNSTLLSRLDRWLKRQYPTLTQGMIEKLLRQGKIRVNGQKTTSGTRVSAEDDISVPKAFLKTLTQKPAPLTTYKPEDIDYLLSLIIWEDEEICVLNKPSDSPWDMTKVNEEDLRYQRVIFNDVTKVKWRNFCTYDQVADQLIKAGFTDIEFIPDSASIRPVIVAKKD